MSREAGMSSSPSLRLQTLALLGRQFLAQAIADGGSLDEVIAGTLLHPRPQSGRETAAAALTGRIRSDAGMLRQASQNAEEGVSIAKIAQGAATSVENILTKMQTIAQAVKNGESTAADAAGAYNSLASNLKGIVSGTRYNGMALLDKDGWAGDERLARSGDGGTAELSLQMGGAPSGFTLYDLSDLKNFNAAADLDPANLDATLGTLSERAGTAKTLASGYRVMAGTYANEAKSLDHQAGILAVTAARAQAGAAEADAAQAARTGKTPDGMSESLIRSMLLDMLLRDQGRLVDAKS